MGEAGTLESLARLRTVLTKGRHSTILSKIKPKTTSYRRVCPLLRASIQQQLERKTWSKWLARKTKIKSLSEIKQIVIIFHNRVVVNILKGNPQMGQRVGMSPLWNKWILVLISEEKMQPVIRAIKAERLVKLRLALIYCTNRLPGMPRRQLGDRDSHIRTIYTHQVVISLSLSNVITNNFWTRQRTVKIWMSTARVKKQPLLSRKVSHAPHHQTCIIIYKNRLHDRRKKYPNCSIPNRNLTKQIWT